MGLKDELDKLESRFHDFHAQRKVWDREVKREIPTELPPEVTDTEPVDYQSAILEKWVYDHVEVLRMNPTRFDINCLDTSEGAKKTERMVLLSMARNWVAMNENRWWDAAVGEGQVRHGVKVMWLRYRSRKQKMRGEKTDEIRVRWPFYWSNTNLYGCFWTMNEGEADAFYYKYTVPVLECDVKKNGQKVTLDGLGKLGWLGLHEEQDKTVADKKVDIIVRDARKLDGSMCQLEGCDHPMREITVFICPEGKTDAAEEVDNYDSPFPGCSFFVIGARESYHETDFHQKYRPLMMPAYQEQFHQNYLNTQLATYSRDAYGDQDVYVDGSTIPQHIAAQMGEGGFTGKIERSPKNSNEVQIFPGKLERWPKAIDPHLATLISNSERRLGEVSPNRFMTGSAFTEASNATGTAFLQQAQQAALPYNGLLGQSDGSIKKCFEFCHHAIRMWGMEDGEGESKVPTRYYAALTGTESTYRYSGKPGELVYVDADMLGSYDFDIVLKTESRTVAEEGARWLQAKDKYMTGVITFAQLLQDAGIFDVEQQLELLYGDRVRATLLPTEMEMTKGYALFKASAFSGADFTAMAQIGQTPQGDPASDAGTLSGVPSNDNMGRAAEQVALSAASIAGGASGGSSPVG